MARKPKAHPKAESWETGVFSEMVRCPVCGYEADIQNFDVGGADEGCLFCNNCDTEIDVT